MARYKFTTVASGLKSKLTGDHPTIEEAILEMGKQPMEGWVELLDNKKRKYYWSKLPTDYLFEAWKSIRPIKVGKEIEVVCPNTGKTKSYFVIGRNFAFDKFVSYMVAAVPNGRCITTVNPDFTSQFPLF